ncbi:MAG: YdcF family protein [Betaproteobacteria bacterium]
MYELISACLDPFLLLFVCIAAASLNLWRRRRDTRRRLLLLNVPLLLLAIICTPAFAYLATGSLEWRYMTNDTRLINAPAIVVLGGLLKPAVESDLRFQLGDNTRLRCLTAAELYHQAPCPVVLSGGKVDPSAVGPALAQAMRDQLLLLKVKATDLILEDRSRTTYENAVESAKILKARGINRVSLITDATHLWRAERCFQAQGIDVQPIGSSYAASHLEWSIFTLVPSPGAGSAVSSVAHEWMGMLWYWIRGRI